jgi:hypothetical protein
MSIAPATFSRVTAPPLSTSVAGGTRRFENAIALVYGDAIEKQRRLAADRCPSCELNVRRADKKSSFGI